jgi:hypothetical protein
VLLLFLNHPHSFSVNDHQYHHQFFLVVQSSVLYLLFQFHHDQSSSNVFHLFHHDHVTSSLNVGSNMDLKPNNEPSFNVLVLLTDTQLHATSSFNTTKLQLALFVNSKTLVLLSIAQQLMFNNMELHFLMLLHLFHQLVLLVLLKILHHQVLSELWVMVVQYTVKVHHSAMAVA